MAPQNENKGEHGFHDRFQKLVDDLGRSLGPTSGIDSEDVDPSRLQELMKQYKSNESEWKKYAFEDPGQNYTRNLVDRGNGKSNLLILVWSPGRGSAIHDHANAHCIMKILKGSLKETRYAWPEKGNEASPLSTEQETTIDTEGVSYMSDQLGLHKISNPDPHDFAVSLHLYTPPNAERHGFGVFNGDTGKKLHAQQGCFYSEYCTKLKDH